MSAVQDCRVCGAPIRWVVCSGTRLAIDANESYAGPKRYAVLDYTTDPWTVVPIADHSVLAGYCLHEHA